MPAGVRRDAWPGGNPAPAAPGKEKRRIADDAAILGVSLFELLARSAFERKCGAFIRAVCLPAVTRLILHRSQHVAHGLEDVRDLLFVDDERRREREDVAREAHQHARLEALHERFVSARARRAVARFEFDARDHAEIAHVLHVLRAAQRMGRASNSRRHRRARARTGPRARYRSSVATAAAAATGCAEYV